MNNRILVEAGAGCGKTYSIVETYLAYTISGYNKTIYNGPIISPNKIITLTFTESSALEMKNRILSKAEELNQESLIKEINNSGFIGTIHAYCYKLIYPFLSDLGYRGFDSIYSPETLVIDRKKLILQCLDLYSEKNSLWNYYSINEICQLTLSIWDIDCDKYLEKLEDFTTDSLKNWESFLLKLSDEANSAIKQAGEFSEYPNWLNQLINNLNNKNFKLYTPISLCKGKGSRALAKKFSSLYENTKLLNAFIKEKYLNFLDYEYQQQLKQAIQHIFEFKDFCHKYYRKKLSFSDLEKCLIQLISKDSKLISFPKLIIVDEFQDTNPNQIKLLKLLSNDETNWYFVGDPKQSIYRFRQASSSTFNKIKEEVNQEQLSTNYRSTKNLLNIINPLQQKLFNNSKIDPSPQILSPGVEETNSKIKNSFVSLKEFSDQEQIFPYILDEITKNKLEKTSTNGFLFLSWKKLNEFSFYLNKHNIKHQVGGTSSISNHILTDFLSAMVEWIYDNTQVLFLEIISKWLTKDLPIEKLAEIQNWSNLNTLGIFHCFCELFKPHLYPSGSAWAISVENFILETQKIDPLQVENPIELTQLLRINLAKISYKNECVVNDPGIYLFTIHGSKGLQFNNVFLPELYSKQNYDNSLLIKNNNEFSLNIKINEKTTPNLYHIWIKNKEKIQLEAEKKRLLYVALTRAENQINIYSQKLKPINSKLKPISLLTHNDNNHPVLWNNFLMDSLLEIQSLHKEAVKIVKIDNENSQNNMAKETSENVQNQDLFYIPIQATNNLLPTLNHKRISARKYISAEKPQISFFKKDEGKKNINSNINLADLGTSLHKVLENWNGNLNSLEKIIPDKFLEYKNLFEKIRSMPELADFWQASSNNPATVIKEIPILLKNNQNTISGICDVFWMSDQNTATIIDWKFTSNIKLFDQKERISETKNQLLLYKSAFTQFSEIKTLAVIAEINSPFSCKSFCF